MEKPAHQKDNHHHPALDHDSHCAAAPVVTWHGLCWSADIDLWPGNVIPQRQQQQEGRTGGAQVSASFKMTPETLSWGCYKHQQARKPAKSKTCFIFPSVIEVGQHSIALCANISSNTKRVCIFQTQAAEQRGCMLQLPKFKFKCCSRF